MARLEDLRTHFTPLSWADKLVFVEEYRKKRYNDLNTVQTFDLGKAAKTKSAKAREVKPKKEKAMKKPAINKAEYSPEQLDLLAKLGLV